MTLLVEANHIPTSHLHPRQIVRAGILARGGYATTHDGFQPIKSRIVDTIPSLAVHRVLHWNMSLRSSRGSDTALRSSPSSRVQSALLRPAYRGSLSCVHHRGRRESPPSKAAVRFVRSPTDLSVARFPASASWFFGLKTPHHTSLRQSAAASDRQSAICQITIGQAMRSPRSSLRSFDVIQCATCG